VRTILAVLVAVIFARTSDAAGDFVFAHGGEVVDAGAVGEVVFTEQLSDPVLVADALGEWIELGNVGGRRIDLRNCTIADLAGAPAILPAITIEPGATVVLARSADPLQNGGVAAQATFSFALTGTGTLQLQCGPRMLDAMSWVQSEVAGRSRSLDPGRRNGVDNDLESSFCASTATYNGTDNGTPGALNETCPNNPDPPPPVIGELRLSEVMPDPTGTLLDQNAEWIELRSSAPVPVGMGTCALDNGAASSSTLTGIVVPPGQIVVVARSTDPVQNGGIATVGAFNFALPNTSATIRLLCGGVVFDQMTYATTNAGRSIIRDGTGAQCIAPPGTTPYFDSNFGTPTADNLPSCP